MTGTNENGMRRKSMKDQQKERKAAKKEGRTGGEREQRRNTVRKMGELFLAPN